MLLPDLVESPPAGFEPAERVLPQPSRRLILGDERLLDDEAMILLTDRLQVRKRTLMGLLPADPASLRLRV